MSYCRQGHESDVYVWTDGDYFHIWLHTGEEADLDDDFPNYPVRLQTVTLRSLQFTLEILRKSGYKIPDEAFTRIARELSEPA